VTGGRATTATPYPGNLIHRGACCGRVDGEYTGPHPPGLAMPHTLLPHPPDAPQADHRRTDHRRASPVPTATPTSSPAAASAVCRPRATPGHRRPPTHPTHPHPVTMPGAEAVTPARTDNPAAEHPSTAAHRNHKTTKRNEPCACGRSRNSPGLRSRYSAGGGSW
jgi:hypothetical protein